MRSTNLVHRSAAASRKATRVLSAIIGLLILLGFSLTQSAEGLFAYFVVVGAAVSPSVLWTRMRAPGIPIFPVITSAYIPYFAFPMVSRIESAQTYGSSDITRAAWTLALFLVTATAVWRVIASKAPPSALSRRAHSQRPEIIPFIIIGLVIAILFYSALLSGWLVGAGAYFGVLRSMAVTLGVITCFLIGVSHAEGLLRGVRWAASLGALGLLIILSWSSLLLVSGIIFALAAILGYTIIAKRIPYAGIALVAITVTILHAGKAEMRDRSWYAGSRTLSSVTDVPAFSAEWFGEGLAALAAGNGGQSVLDRTSLLQMLLRVQRETPETIDYLFGETYALLPAIIVPRFIDSNKPASQIGMSLLNERYGLLTAEGTATTAIGWGLVPEAYANFGYLGVVAIALLVGGCCGALAIWSADADIVSLPMLVSISTMMTLISLEMDFIQLASTLFQSFISILLLLFAYKRLVVRQATRRASRTSVPVRRAVSRL
jgi:hypothetical protein